MSTENIVHWWKICSVNWGKINAKYFIFEIKPDWGKYFYMCDMVNEIYHKMSKFENEK